MQRRASLIVAGRAFAVVAGASLLINCGSSPTAPSAVASVSSVSTVVNAHTHSVGVSASDQLHPADTTDTSSTDSAHHRTVALTAGQLTTLAAEGSVTVTSTISSVTGNQRHDFTFQGKKV